MGSGDELAKMLDGDLPMPNDGADEDKSIENNLEKYRCAFCWIYTTEWVVDSMGKYVCENEDECIQRKRDRMGATRKWREAKEQEKTRT